MKKIIAKVNFTLNDISYIKGEEILVNNYKTIVKLNEIGYIEPLDYKDLVLIKRELEGNINKEEIKWDLTQANTQK